jgi:hypothetical protein
MNKRTFKDAIAEIERLQESLRNITEAATGQRTDMSEASVIATIKVLQLRIAQLNRLIAIDDRGEPIDQARYDALLIELHRLRHQ